MNYASIGRIGLCAVLVVVGAWTPGCKKASTTTHRHHAATEPAATAPATAPTTRRTGRRHATTATVPTTLPTTGPATSSSPTQ